ALALVAEAQGETLAPPGQDPVVGPRPARIRKQTLGLRWVVGILRGRVGDGIAQRCTTGDVPLGNQRGALPGHERLDEVSAVHTEGAGPTDVDVGHVRRTSELRT